MFHVHYNTFVSDKWNVNLLMARCVQEEERQKSYKGDSVNFNKQTIKKQQKNSKKPFKKQGKPYDKASTCTNKAKQFENFPVPPDTCMYCKKTKHYQRKCPDFLQNLLENGKDQVTFVDGSLYIDYPSYS